MLDFKTSPENAADIEVIATMLRELPYGATLGYDAITSAIGRDIREHRHILNQSRRLVEEETGTLFEISRAIGIKRLNSIDTPSVGLACIRKVRKAAKRGVDRLNRIRVNDLSPDDAHKIIAHRSQLGAIALVADGRKSTTLTAEAKRTNAPVPVGRVLDLFKT